MTNQTRAKTEQNHQPPGEHQTRKKEDNGHQTPVQHETRKKKELEITEIGALVDLKGILVQASASQQIFLAWLDITKNFAWLDLTFCWLEIFQQTFFERYLKKTTKNGVISNCI